MLFNLLNIFSDRPKIPDLLYAPMEYSAIKLVLVGVWTPDSGAKYSLRSGSGIKYSRRYVAEPVQSSVVKRPPPWFIGMTAEFVKDIKPIDKTLQSRILSALAEISKGATELRGDTMKPLTGNMKSCWRYRIGDYRLVYLPDSTTGSVSLLSFSSRGAVYE